MNAHIKLPPTTNSFLSSQWNVARTDCSFIKIVSKLWFLSSLNSVALDETWYSFQRSALLPNADYTFATPVEFGCWEIPPSLIPLINANNTLNRIHYTHFENICRVISVKGFLCIVVTAAFLNEKSIQMYSKEEKVTYNANVCCLHCWLYINTLKKINNHPSSIAHS